MDLFQPPVRRRGSFIGYTDTGDPEVGEHESAEGITFRIRIIRPLLKRQVAGGASRWLSRSPRRGPCVPSRRTSVGTQRSPYRTDEMVRSETATGTRPLERTPH